ncbi:TetR/AcrR family transcriptional regulator [Halobacteriovorax sp. GB3]|uniref:TetR/AcrR family transcriptional regulator n=1 Tax=Halobacteriovorax sp. GB3 TaxID=2719615 RepID=UPI00236014CA|nr:TetR/AcrR family transcriptional regulator [Halobacteriovorax sp. GB3]MDD0852957.1 TetR/AcrR family transcriptional regulator [Halobacteriovorax sp. GB3]
MIEYLGNETIFGKEPSKGEKKKMEIIQAAIECFSSIGLENTTYQSIAEKIETRRAHVAYHFKEKELIFESSVRYILWTYQKISLGHVKKAKSGREMLHLYVEAVFEWAKRYPEQVSVMLLLYYQCTLNEKLLTLHDELRSLGEQRIYYILSEKVENFPKEKCSLFSKQIQNLTSAAILDSFTTKSKGLDQAKKETLEIIDLLLK